MQSICAFFVVPFSNAKVVGSFRMARLKRVPALKLKISPVFQIVNFAEVLLLTDLGNYTTSTLKAL